MINLGEASLGNGLQKESGSLTLMSNGNCGQHESSLNCRTGVDKMGGRKQPNVPRPSHTALFLERREKEAAAQEWNIADC